MKKILKYSLFFFTMLIFADCDNGYIEIPADGQIDITTAFNNENDAIYLVNGCYDVLQFNWGVEVPRMLGDLCSDNAWKGGDSPSDQGEFLELMYFTAGTNNKFIQYYWKSYWMGIYRCNLSLQEIPKIEEINNTLRNRLLAEAKFLRAYYYFELVRNFGDLPILTSPISSDEIKMPRQPKKDVYEQLIEKDLIEVATVLPQKSEYSSVDMGRATRGAALSLLTKVYLYEKKWDDAYSTSKTVIEEGEYSLQPNFRNIFDIDYPNSVESIFEVQNSGNQTYIEGAGLPVGTRSRADGGWGWFIPSTNLLLAFEKGDPRKNLTIVSNGDTHVEDHLGEPYKVTPLPPYRMDYKLYIPKAKRVANEWQHTNYDYKLIRYADLLLMYAESANESSKVTDALWALEQVRARARNMQANPSVLPEVTVTNQSDVREAIRHERRVELAMEFERFYDLVRWGIAKEVLNKFADFNVNSGLTISEHPEQGDEKGRLFQTGKHELFAIPVRDVELAGWTNNPGY